MILDVGCGLRWCGAVNVDLYINPTIHRAGNQSPYRLNTKGLPNFIRADIHHLPFPDNCFHIVLCRHVLEHVGVNVTQAIKELLRVTKAKLEITVPHFLVSERKVPGHARAFRSRHFHKIFRNYFYSIDWKWRFTFKRFPIIFPAEVIVTVYKCMHAKR